MHADSIDDARIEVQDQWDFYLCRVDDRAASIFLNLWFRDQGPIKSADRLYWCQIEILEPGDHGMGVGDDANSLQDIEDAIADEAQDAGLYYVGRLRNDGRWQVVFYGRPKLESTLRGIVADTIPESSGRDCVVGSKPDPEWSYYFTFLFPDAERWRWMSARKVVERLHADGDRLTRERRVDHWAYFDNATARDAFVDSVLKEGFEVERSANDAQGERPFSAQVFRVNSVRLEDIHGVIMFLVETAEAMGGEYDGWETSVERP